MSEQSGSMGLSDLEQARVEVADQLRDLTHALMAYEQDPETLRGFASQLAQMVPVASTGGWRARELESWAEERNRSVMPAEGERFPPHLDRPISGQANPLSIPIEVRRMGGRAAATMTLRKAHEGAPERSHGGFVTAIFDDMCGYVLAMRQVMAFTAFLKVDFHEPTPIGEPITFSAWLEHHEGRKLTIRGECRRGESPTEGPVLTSCDSLFVQIALPN